MVVGDEVGVGGESVILGAVGFYEFLGVFFFEAAFEGGAEVAVELVLSEVEGAGGAWCH